MTTAARGAAAPGPESRAPAGERAYDIAVLLCVGGAFFSALLSMGGAAAQGTDRPVRWLAAGLAVHAVAMCARARADRARLRLVALLPAGGALALLLDGLAHPATAWKAHQSAVTAACVAAAFWLTAHHTRHAAHRRLIWGTLSVTCALLGALTFGTDSPLCARLAGRVPDAVYTGHATGPFGTPGEFVALLLPGFFAAATHTLLPRAGVVQRMSAFYAAALIACAILAADTPAAHGALTAGCATLGLLWFRNRHARLAIALGAMALAALTAAAHAGRPDIPGLFRSAAGTAPLPSAAGSIFLANPWFGTGCGGFANAFENHRPTGWPLNPDGAGGVFHQTLAENGLVGTILILGPALFLLLWAVNHLRRLPRTQTVYDRQFDRTVRFTPEWQLALFSACSGAVACFTALALDYARPNMAVLLALALIGGSLIRDLPGPGPVIRLAPPRSPAAGRRRLALLAAPALLLPAGALGVLAAAEHTAAARDMLRTLGPRGAQAAPSVTHDVRLEVLRLARDRAERALVHAPGNAEARLVLADTILAQLRSEPATPGAGRALALAGAAAAAEPARPAAAFTRIALLRAHGRDRDATAAVDALHAAAPGHPAVSLEYARVHLAEPAKRAEILLLLEALLTRDPDRREARDLLRVLRLTPH